MECQSPKNSSTTMADQSMKSQANVPDFDSIPVSFVPALNTEQAHFTQDYGFARNACNQNAVAVTPPLSCADQVRQQPCACRCGASRIAHYHNNSTEAAQRPYVATRTSSVLRYQPSGHQDSIYLMPQNEPAARTTMRGPNSAWNVTVDVEGEEGSSSAAGEGDMNPLPLNPSDPEIQLAKTLKSLDANDIAMYSQSAFYASQQEPYQQAPLHLPYCQVVQAYPPPPPVYSAPHQPCQSVVEEYQQQQQPEAPLQPLPPPQVEQPPLPASSISPQEPPPPPPQSPRKPAPPVSPKPKVAVMRGKKRAASEPDPNKIVPTKRDVLSGKGGRTLLHNKHFMELCKKYADDYTKTKKRGVKGKRGIAMLIVRQIHDAKGRFLDRNGEGGDWFVTTNEQALGKVAHCMRDVIRRK